MATRIFEIPPKETQYKTDKVADSKRQQHFNDVTFTCHLCQYSVKRATFLSCLHSFCKTCIDQKVKQEGNESIQCPLCPSYEDDSLELQSNPLPELINKLKQLKTNTDNLRCTDCVFGDPGETAVAYCVECKATICKIDLKSHEKYNIGHLILQLHTLQESSVQDILTSLQATTTGDAGIGTKSKLPEEYLHPYSEGINITSSTNMLQEECIQEANSRICQLEDRKSNLEKKLNTQTTQVLTFFQQLYNQLEIRQAVLLEELSNKYQTLITPLEDAIQQLKQTVTYTGYVGVLSMYSYVTGISNRPVDKLQDISLFLNDFNIPSDSYNVNVNHQTKQNIENFLNKFLTVNKAKNPKEQSAFVAKMHKSYRLANKQTGQMHDYSDNPIDVAYNSSTNVFYVLFRTHWKTYQQIHNSLRKRQTIKVTAPASFQLNSSIAILNTSVIIISDNIIYVYSEEGKVLQQIKMINQIGTIPNPKLYTFSDINSVFIPCIESPNIYKVNYQTGVKEGTINILTYAQQHGGFFGHLGMQGQHPGMQGQYPGMQGQYPGMQGQYPGMPGQHLGMGGQHLGMGLYNFVDMVRSTTQTNQLLILHSVNPHANNNPCYPNSNNNQYYIQVYNINNLQYQGLYTLSQQMSPFCCITTITDTLYVVDVSTGSIHKYNLNQIQQNVQNNNPYFQPNYDRDIDYDYGMSDNRHNQMLMYTQQNHNLNQESVLENSIPQSTDIKGKTLKDTMIRAFSHETKNQIMLLSSGEIHFIT
ncbi:E3 ubiquitin-protein ligase TRIM71-like isoform X1 [Oopsacas minuta]|uniref:E3 ubiquitin-protein ligase TRIM71-like isoform X1 n=1 Tax=Oopsacas minuta TaxID=111878 RepID=A0AAV7JDY8_9METZ|nr:E3 ubiquitin-protein ligase TRIM71-like isoform X1 [Oopsacas minuta]